MPYCPTCKQAYPAGKTECPTDHAALVDELPFQSRQGEGTTWVEITSTGTDDEARIITGFLEAEGIPAQIENVKFSMEPINFGTMGDIRVYVGAEDEARAQQLLKQRNTDFDRLEDDADTIVTDEGTAEITEDEEIEPTETE
jgi:Putative prokaryotic signal transducing protein